MKLIEQIMEEFDKSLKCINKDCDQNGCIPTMVEGSDGEPAWEAQQCQYCFEIRFPAQELFKSSLKQAYNAGLEDAKGVAPHEKGYLEHMENKQSYYFGNGFKECRTEFINNINQLTLHD